MKISYEFYPPKDLNYQKVVEEYSVLSQFNPRFVSITFGALGSSQDKSLGLIEAFKKDFPDLDVAAHLTLVGKSVDEVSSILDQFKELGINKIVAVRGDSPDGAFVTHPNGFKNTADFVEFLVSENMEVFVSAYPEPHPDSEGFDFDLNLLEQKTNAGAHQSISQFCFSEVDHQKLVTSMSERGIKNELIAGIMPIYNIASLCSMAERCGTHIQSHIIDQFSEDPQENEAAAIRICIDQVKSLQNLGISNFHFYALNQSSLLEKIFKKLEYRNFN